MDYKYTSRSEEDTMELAEYSQAIKLTVTSVNMSSGLLVPEVSFCSIDKI